MKIKNAALFVIISALLWVLSGIYYLIFVSSLLDSFIQYWKDFVKYVLLLGVPVAYIVWSITLLKPDRKPTKWAAIFLCIMTAIWTAIELNYRITNAAYLYDFYYEHNPLFLYGVINLRSLTPVLMFVAAVLWTTGKPGNIKKGAIFFMGGTLLWIFSMTGERMEFLFANQWKYILKLWNLQNTFQMLRLLYPIALFVLGITLFKRSVQESEAREVKENENEGEEVSVIPSVLDWFITFLLTSIPFAGIILLMIWGINTRKRPRKTWALNTLLWSMLAWALNIFIYFPALRILRPGTSYYYIALIIWGMFAIATGIILYAHVREKQERIFEDEGNEDYYPVSVRQWILYTLMIGLPVIGIICLVYWAVDRANPLRRNWALAYLLWLGIMIICLFYLYTTIVEIAWINSQRTYFRF